MLKLSGPLLEKYNSQSVIARDLNSITPELAKKNPTLWGAEAATEASVRLNWIDLPDTSQKLIPKLNELKIWANNLGLTHLILCGMGGSSLAPEVMGKTFGKPITILDSTDPDQISMVDISKLSETLIVIGSKSGSTIETASQRAFFEDLLVRNGLEAKEHVLVITDPNSPLDVEARTRGFQVINADANVGGRFSALGAFGLVPAALMGIDISMILNEAHSAAQEFAKPNSAVTIVATLILEQSAQFIAFSDSGSNVPGLADWIEQLIAESTGKDQKGRIPIVLENIGAEIFGSAPRITFGQGGDLSISGTLAEHFIFWEWVTALIGRGLAVDPFNQPNVTEAKERTSALLLEWDGKIKMPIPSFEDEDFKIFGERDFSSLSDALAQFFLPTNGYIAVMAYLNRVSDTKILEIREMIADKTKRPTTFGWGPRFLHSTGQFHKGGQPNGSFLQISGACLQDIKIPDKPYSFQTLLMAQVFGDGQALVSRNLPTLHIYLKNRSRGVERLLSAIRKL